MNKKVSIIVPVYNVKNYLRECLNSLLGQTYTNIEVILIDDGSTDGSGSICKEYADKDKRIKLIVQENQGAAMAKNVGLDNVSGEYVAFLDSDDFVELQWIEMLVEALEEFHVDVVECEFAKKYVHSIAIEKDVAKSGIYTCSQYMEQYLDHWTCSLFWNKLFKADLVKEIRFRRERRCIDDEFFTYKVLSNAKTILHIENVLYYYRQRSSSAVSNKKNREQKTEDALEILIERYEWIKEFFPHLVEVYLKHDINIMFYFARDFLFTQQSIKKFRRISRYYFGERIHYYSGLNDMKKAMKLLFISKRQLLVDKEEDKNENICRNMYI